MLNLRGGRADAIKMLSPEESSPRNHHSQLCCGRSRGGTVSWLLAKCCRAFQEFSKYGFQLTKRVHGAVSECVKFRKGSEEGRPGVEPAAALTAPDTAVDLVDPFRDRGLDAPPAQVGADLRGRVALVRGDLAGPCPGTSRPAPCDADAGHDLRTGCSR